MIKLAKELDITLVQHFTPQVARGVEMMRWRCSPTMYPLVEPSSYHAYYAYYPDYPKLLPLLSYILLPLTPGGSQRQEPPPGGLAGDRL
jgi:hypothetical protein